MYIDTGLNKHTWKNSKTINTEHTIGYTPTGHSNKSNRKKQTYYKICLSKLISQEHIKGEFPPFSTFYYVITVIAGL